MSLFTNEVVALGATSTCGGLKIQNSEYLEVYLSATSLNSTTFIAPVAYTVVGVSEVHGTAGGSGASVTLENLSGTTANGAGTTILTAPLVLTGAANTVQTTPVSNIKGSASTLAAGSRLGVVLSGTLTGLANCCVHVVLARA